MNKPDHTIATAIITLVGIIVTITIGIFTVAYINNQNVDRDKFYAEHCKSVTKSTDNTYNPPAVTYRCDAS